MRRPVRSGHPSPPLLRAAAEKSAPASRDDSVARSHPPKQKRRAVDFAAMHVLSVFLPVFALCLGLSAAQRGGGRAGSAANVPVPRVDRNLMNWALEQGLET